MSCLCRRGLVVLGFFCFLLLSACVRTEKVLYQEHVDTPRSLDTFDVDDYAYITALAQGTISHDMDVLPPANNSSIVVIWDAGKYIGDGYGSGETIRKNIEAARDSALMGYEDRDILDLDVHVFVLDTWRPFDEGYIHGVHAVEIYYDGRSLRYRPSYAIETNRDLKKTIVKMCEEIDIPLSTCSVELLDIRYAPALHLARMGGEPPRVYYRGKLLEPVEALDLVFLESILEPGLQWLWNNIDGDFTYVYNPSSGVYSSNNNMIRQFMASRLLASYSHSDPALLALHIENLDHIFSTWYAEEGDYGYVWYGNKSKLGAMALLIRTLVASPLRDRYSEELTKLTTTLLSLQEENGLFRPRYKEPDYAYDADYLLTFYSGEALLALVELYEVFADERILQAALRGQDAYLARYVDAIDERYYPAYVPRHTMSLYKLYQITQDQRYADAVFTLNDKLVEEMLEQDATLPDILGRFYNPVFAHYGTPHSASDGVYTEGLVYAYMLAEALGDEIRVEQYRDALTLAVHNLAQLQYREGDAYFLQYPQRVMGALRFRADDNRIRVDTTQHAIDALQVLYDFISSS